MAEKRELADKILKLLEGKPGQKARDLATALSVDKFT